MSQPRTVAIVLGAATAVVAASAVVRHTREASRGRAVPGGIIIGDAAVYDAASRLVLGPFLRRIAADVAATAPEGARVLEIGCGPGHLSIMLARRHGLDVTGVDLDPRWSNAHEPTPCARRTVAATARRSWSATWPRLLSPTRRSTSW
ncbi:MAG TPA: class I SAM-dependent methyltransferase [Actinomycetota bacterium]